MLKKDSLLSKMIKHFSKWMDIRRKVQTSNGGKILGAIAEEAALLQSKIDEYVDMHFLENNIENKEKILSHVYIFNIGNVSIELIRLENPNLNLTKDIKEFYDNEGFAYVQDGYIVIKSNDLKTQSVIYYYKNYKQTVTPKLIKIWNIFDEFALYVGLKRYDLPIVESNEDLIKRILISRQEKINSSKDGLVYALYASLVNLLPHLTKNDIVIETPNSNNILELSSNNQTVLEEMAIINRDICRVKKWDIDYWNHDLKSLDYLPHTWDFDILSKANGIGDNDDLMPYLLHHQENLNVQVNMYKKDEEVITKYIKDNPIPIPISLKLVKPSNTISPITVDFKVTSCPLTDVTPYNLGLQYSTTSHVERVFDISQLIDINDLSYNDPDYTIDDNRILEAGTYNIKIRSRTDYEAFKIYKLMVGETNYLKENATTHFKDNVLRVDSELFFGNKTYHFDKVENLENSIDGMTISNCKNEAHLEVNLSNVAKEMLKINVFCDPLAIGAQYISSNFFNETDGVYTSYHPQATLTVKMKANYIKARVSGNSLVKAYRNGILMYNRFTIEDEYIDTVELETPQDYMFVISSITDINITVSELEYKSYALTYSTLYGGIAVTDYGFILPDYMENTLYISLISYTENAPVIRGVHVGPSPANELYETGNFTISENQRILIDAEGAIIDLEKINPADNSVLNVIEDYSPKLKISTINTTTLLLDLKDYSKIDAFYCDGAELKMRQENNRYIYELLIYKDVTIKEAFLSAEKKSKTTNIYFNSIFNIDSSKDEKLYIANLYPGLIIKRADKTELIDLATDERTKSIFNTNGDYTVLNYTLNTDDYTLPNSPFTAYFETKTDNKAITYMDYKITGYVSNLYFKNKDTSEYVAYNQVYSFQKQLNDVKIINTFYPFVPDQLLFYKLESLNSNKVAFRRNDLFEEKNVYSVGMRNVNILTNFNLETMIDNETIYLTKNVTASKLIDLDTLQGEKKEIDFAEYIIYPDSGQEIHYSSVKIDSIEENPSHFYTETIIVEQDRFNKLKYCHINHILKITINNTTVNESYYKCINLLGVIEWNEDVIDSIVGTKATIVYQIDKPEAIELSNDFLYKPVSTINEAYKLIDSFTTTIDFSKTQSIMCNENSFKYADWITVDFDSPGYNAEIMPNYININQILTNQKLAVQTGYYYLNDKQYYLFSKEDKDNTLTSSDITYTNVLAADTLELFAFNENQLLNSSFKTLGMDVVYESNFKTYSPSNSLSYLTACDTYGSWIFKGTVVNFKRGLNNQALNFNPCHENGYGLLNLTDYLKSLSEDVQISFYHSGLTVYLAEEERYQETNYCFINPLELIEICTTNSEKLITYYFKVSNQKQYYLVVTGSGILDDLILANASDSISHEKNVCKLHLDFEEETVPSINRFVFNRFVNRKSQGAFVNSNGFIEAQKNIDWSITKIQDFSLETDWRKCAFNRCELNGDSIIGCAKDGKVTLPIIEIKDKNAIDYLLFKINHLTFPNMKNLAITVLGSNSYNGNYIKLIYTNKPRFQLPNVKIYQYLKIEIELEEKQILDSLCIYANYISTDTLKLTSSTNKIYLSEIYDLNSQNHQVLQEFKYSDLSSSLFVQVFYRVAKEGYNETIFSDWTNLSLNNTFAPIELGEIRYIQFKVILLDNDATIKIDYFDIKTVFPK